MDKPPIAPPEHKFRVTYHAVTRYVQRIVGVAIDTPEGSTPRHIATAHCDAINMSIDDVKAIILCPAVIAACLTGMTTVTTRSFRVVVTPLTGVVVTISEPRKNRVKRKKLKIRSRREQKKDQKELIRRDNSRPSRRLPTPESAP